MLKAFLTNYFRPKYQRGRLIYPPFIKPPSEEEFSRRPDTLRISSSASPSTRTNLHLTGSDAALHLFVSLIIKLSKIQLRFTIPTCIQFVNFFFSFIVYPSSSVDCLHSFQSLSTTFSKTVTLIIKFISLFFVCLLLK